MTRTIALDAGVLIALFDAHDAHHVVAKNIFARHLDARLCIAPLTLAEVLVRPVAEARADAMLDDIERLGIDVCAMTADSAVRLATLRARTRLRMPDCCVLWCAEHTDAVIATFDAGLTRAAREVRIEVVTGG